MNKAIVFITLLALTVANIDDSTMPGGWHNYKFSNGFQSDSSNPLTQIYRKLSAELEEKGISDIVFTSATSQVVNGQNFKISFTYTEEDVIKTGYCLAYVSFSGETCEIHEVKLEESRLTSVKDMTYGGWSNYTIPSGFKQDPTHPLKLAMDNLSQKLINLNMTFVKFVNVQSQVVAGYKFKIEFQFLNKNGEERNGTCVIYVRPWDKHVEILELSVATPLKMSTEAKDHMDGGWQTYNYNLSELQNGTSSFATAYNKLVNTLLKKAIKIVSVSSVQQQIVSGVNYKISFIYSENNNLKVGDAIVYVQDWTKTFKVTSLNLAGQTIHY
ncbi:hypothetical protein ABPG72_007472 [Tetrahymena utriculariae]